MIHSNSSKNHKIENWTYSNAAARVAASGFLSTDIGKLAYQSDNGTYWRLTATTPTWAQVSPSTDKLVPAGGTTNQVLKKNSGTDGDTSWTTPATPPSSGQLVPAGGTTNQVLKKNSGTDGDTSWATPSSGAAVIALDYHFDSSVTTSGDPGAGIFRKNFPANDHLYMAEVDGGGQDYYPYQAQQTVKNWIIMRSVTSPKTKWAIFTVAGTIVRHSDANNWCDIPVTLWTQSATDPFAASGDFTVEFSGPSTVAV